MNRRRGWIAIAGLGAIFAVHVNGCSLMGLATGAMIDAKAPRLQQIRASELVRVSPGSRVTILLDDSTFVRGTYRGSTRLADDAYRVIYEIWRATHPRGPSFPEIGEPVELNPGGKGAFGGFVAEGVELESRRWGSTATPFDRDGWLERRDGSRLDLWEVRDLALAGDLPIATALRIETEGGERRIALDRVALIAASTSRHAARTGFLVGLAADAMIVAMAAGIASQSQGCTIAPDVGTGWYSRVSRPATSSGERLASSRRASPSGAIPSRSASDR